MNRPAAASSICFAGGAGLATAGLGPVTLPVTALLAVLWAVYAMRRGKRQAVQSGVLLLLFLAGNLYYHWRQERLAVSHAPPLPVQEQEADVWQAELAGTIASPVEVDGDRAVFYLLASRWIWEGGTDTALVSGERVYASVRLEEPSEQTLASGWKRGDRIVLSGSVQAPASARNFGGFDFGNYLAQKGVHWALTVKGASGVQVNPPDGFSITRLLRWNDEIRVQAGRRLERLFPGGEAGYMKGLLIGIREDLDPERFRDFSRLGLTHILAISGLHVGVYLWALLALCRKLGLTRERAMGIGFWTTPLYVVFTGSSPSVIRSGITAMTGLFAARRGLLKDGLSLLGLALTGMLVWNPGYVTDVGFQLSFLVTAGLLAGVPAIGRLLPIRSRLLNGSITVALTAQLVSFPLSIYYFNQFSLLSLPANLVLVPLISFVVTPLGYAALLLSYIVPYAGELTAAGVSRLNQLTFWCIEKTDHVPAARMVWPSPSPWWIALYYVLLCLAVGWAGKLVQLNALERSGILLAANGPYLKVCCRAGTAIACVMFALLLAYGYSPYRYTERGTGTVAFLDVGQGDAAWVRTPKGRHLLIDGGGTVSFQKEGEEWKKRQDPYEVGRKTIVPLLKKRGVHKLDYIILSHEDTDHIGGIPAVLEEIPVGAILFNGSLKRTPAADQLFRAALLHHIPLIPVYQGQKWAIDGSTELAVLTPPRAEGGLNLEADKQNELTVCALLTMNGYRFLFTGDMGTAEEDAFTAQWTGLGNGEGAPLAALTALLSPVPRTDVLKVAHHGSKNSTSADWLEFWKPRLSVISVGKNNTYGHPNPLALERLRDAGSAVMRTDLQGEVQITAKPEGLFVRSKQEAGRKMMGIP